MARMPGCVQGTPPGPHPSQTLPRGLCPPPVPTLNSEPTSKQPALTPTPQVTPPVAGLLQVPKRIMMEDHQPPHQVPQGHLHPSQDKISLKPHGFRADEGKGGPLSRWGTEVQGAMACPSHTVGGQTGTRVSWLLFPVGITSTDF